VPFAARGVPVAVATIFFIFFSSGISSINLNPYFTSLAMFQTEQIWLKVALKKIQYFLTCRSQRRGLLSQ